MLYCRHKPKEEQEAAAQDEETWRLFEDKQEAEENQGYFSSYIGY